MFNVDQFENGLINDSSFRQALIGSINDDNKLAWNTFHGNIDEDNDEFKSSTVNHQPLMAPKLISKLKNGIILEGSDVTFQVKLTGNPKPLVYWFKNGSPLICSTRVNCWQQKDYDDQSQQLNQQIITILHIHMALPEDSGYYTLLIENDLGHIVTSSHLIIEPMDELTRLKYFTSNYQPINLDQQQTISR